MLSASHAELRAEIKQQRAEVQRLDNTLGIERQAATDGIAAAFEEAAKMAEDEGYESHIVEMFRAKAKEKVL